MSLVVTLTRDAWQLLVLRVTARILRVFVLTWCIYTRAPKKTSHATTWAARFVSQRDCRLAMDCASNLYVRYTGSCPDSCRPPRPNCFHRPTKCWCGLLAQSKSLCLVHPSTYNAKRESCMHGVLNEVYLQNLFTDRCNFVHEYNEPNLSMICYSNTTIIIL